MFNFLGYKLRTGVVVFIGEQMPTNEMDGVRKTYGIVTKNSNGEYTRNLTPDVVGEVYAIDNFNDGTVELEDYIDLVNNKYSYNDSQSYGDINHGILIPAASLAGGEWVSVSWVDIADKKVMPFAEFVKSVT